MSQPSQAHDDALSASGDGGVSLRSWVARWRLVLVATLLGAALGAGAGLLISPTYTAEARVAVGAGALSAGAATGFPQASSQLASSYARYVNDLGLEDGVAVAASPIPDSSIIRIEAIASRSSEAVAVANKTVERLVSAVNTQGKGETPLNRYRRAANRWAQAQGRLDAAQSELDTLQSEGGGTTTRADELRAQTVTLNSRVASLLLVRDSLGEEYRLRNEAVRAVGLRPVVTATEAVSDRPALVQRYGAIGLVLGGALSLVLTIRRERRRSGHPTAHLRATDEPGPRGQS